MLRKGEVARGFTEDDLRNVRQEMADGIGEDLTK